MTDNRATFLLSEGDIHLLRDAVSHIALTGYSETALCRHLGLRDIIDLQLRAIPIYREERLAARAPLDIAIDLFFLQGVVRTEELGRLLSQEDREVMVRSGILNIDGSGKCRAKASIYPAGNRLVFSDHAWPQLSHQGYSTVPGDQVMFVGADSRWLARATIRRPIHAALDLCTGSGIHALLAAAHSRKVVAVDINNRAVRCAKFNVLASNFNNVEVMAGDLFEPLRNERFDLITANPPFVPSPMNSLTFRDGGPSGEDVQRRIVAGLSEHLSPGGIAQIITEIGERDGEPIVDRVRQWLGNAFMDIHLLRLRTHAAAGYAVKHAEGDTPGAFLDSVKLWADNLRSRGFSKIVSVLLTFQWSNPACGIPWSRVDESLPPRREAGHEIEAIFAAERMIRDPGLRSRLEKGRLNRTGPITLLEGRLLGGDLPPTCRATLMGQPLGVEFVLNPVERDLILCMDQPVEVSTLLAIARQAGMDIKTLYEALEALLGMGLIKLGHF